MNISKDKIKLIATDLDGTLLNSNKEISKYNQEILKIIINDYNVQLILSSGRPYEGVKNYNKLLKNNNYSIIFNGASIVDNSGKVIYKQTVEENDANGLEFGKASTGVKLVEDDEVVSPLKPVIRIATDEDRKKVEENKRKEKNKAVSMAKLMKKENIDIELIKKITGLTIDEIKKL